MDQRTGWLSLGPFAAAKIKIIKRTKQVDGYIIGCTVRASAKAMKNAFIRTSVEIAQRYTQAVTRYILGTSAGRAVAKQVTKKDMAFMAVMAGLPLPFTIPIGATLVGGKIAVRMIYKSLRRGKSLPPPNVNL